ncbi:MAG: hypothetical protein DRQ46_00305 [Gammaproteobacteria bacterium]|nr:MAG: hypothetical protein DRQ46_00305 [Gammaproteobacteria bacterium]
MFPDVMAIVGNGIGEFGKCLGNQIDSHDYVVRFQGFKPVHTEDYGKKANIYVTCLNDTPCGGEYLERWEYGPFDKVYCTWPDPNRIHLAGRKVPMNTRIRFIEKEIHQELWSLLGHKPSTGITFIYWVHKTVGLKHCDLYGFDFWGYKKPYHYWEYDKAPEVLHEQERTLSPIGSHNAAKEYELYKQIRKEYESK